MSVRMGMSLVLGRICLSTLEKGKRSCLNVFLLFDAL